MENLPASIESKLVDLEHEYDELQKNLGYVEVISDVKLFSFLKQKSDRLQSIVTTFKLLKEFQNNDITKSSEITQEYQELVQKLKKEFSEFEKHENECIQIEISSKTEKSVFLQEIKSMFENYFKLASIKFTYTKNSEKSCIIEAHGFNVYDNLKCFSGIFKRVEFGRPQYLTVAILEKKIQCFELKSEDLLIETLKSSGAGGQHINKTESAVRITHTPTKISVKCEDQRSQIQNKERAMELLSKKIQQKYEKNEQNYIKIQRNSIKNAIFSNTPVFELNFDKNIAVLSNGKVTNLKDCLNGNLEKLFL